MNARIIGSFLFVVGLSFAAPVSADDGEAKVKKFTWKAPDGLSIYGEELGKGDTALVFLHGWCGDHEYWKNQVGPFSADYRVIALDLAGHSQSGKDRKEWTVAGLADDVAGAVKELGLKRVVLIGHSMGGPVALMTAKRLPGVAVAVVGVDTLQNADFKMPKEAIDGLMKQFEDDFKKAVGEGF